VRPVRPGSDSLTAQAGPSALRAFVSLLLLVPACATAASNPRPSPARPASSGAQAPRPRAEEAPALPTATVRPVLAARATALLPDATCFARPREEQRLLSYRPLPDVRTEAAFALVAEEGVCKIATHARAELQLGREESLEQTATCGAWRFEPCLPPPLHAAVPSPTFRAVRGFSGRPNWQDMDAQSDGLGERRRDSYTTRIEGSSFSLVHLRSGAVVLYAGETRVEAFRAQAFVMLDGVPHIVTRDAMVRVAEPPVHSPLPSLFTGDHAPEPQGQLWDRQN